MAGMKLDSISRFILIGCGVSLAWFIAGIVLVPAVLRGAVCEINFVGMLLLVIAAFGKSDWSPRIGCASIAVALLWAYLIFVRAVA
jgi:hypothetical protein